MYQIDLSESAYHRARQLADAHHLSIEDVIEGLIAEEAAFEASHNDQLKSLLAERMESARNGQLKPADAVFERLEKKYGDKH